MKCLINIGCGKRIHRDWINLDLHASAPGVVACDLTKGIPVDDGVADMVYSAAVLEHIRPADTHRFLAECRRILRPGGIIRIAVPDLEEQAKVYLETLNRLDRGEVVASADHDWMILEMFDQSVREKSGGAMIKFLARKRTPDTDFILRRIGAEGKDLIDHLQGLPPEPENLQQLSFSQNVPGGCLGRFILKKLLGSNDLESDLEALNVGRFRLRSGEVHQWAYDRISLGGLMLKAGFQDPEKVAHSESRLHGWKDFHLEIDEAGNIEKPDLLVMEAIK
jgi:SAM-dependent methyltransferase